MTSIETLLFGRGIRSLKPGLLIYNEVREDREHRFARRALDAPDGQTTQANPHIMRVARQVPTPATGGLVFELKAKSQEEGEDALDKRLAIAQELKVGRFIRKSTVMVRFSRVALAAVPCVTPM